MKFAEGQKSVLGSYIFGILALVFIAGTHYPQKSVITQHVTRVVVDYKEAVLLNEKQRIDLLISELLDSKSAKCFKAILVRESHLNVFAKNPNSTAKGLGQLLQTTYENLGLKNTSTDPLAQLIASLSYVSRHYGGKSSTCNAWHYWQKHFSY